MATAHSVIATHASTLTAQPCQHPQQSTTELRRQGEMSSSSSLSTHSVPTIPDLKEVLPSPSSSQEPAAMMRVASDAGYTSQETAPSKTIPDAGGERVASSSQSPRRRVARRHSARPSGSTPPQTSADATPLVRALPFPSAWMPPLPYNLDDILYLHEVLTAEELQDLGGGEVDWEDHSKLPEGEDGEERDSFWDLLYPEGSAAFGHISPLAKGYGVASVSTACRDVAVNWSGPSVANSPHLIEQQSSPRLRNMCKTNDRDLSDSENHIPQDDTARRDIASNRSKYQRTMVPRGHALFDETPGSPTVWPEIRFTPATSQVKAFKSAGFNVSAGFASGSSLANREPLAAASLNTGGYVSPTVTSRNDFRGVTSGAASLSPSATSSAGASLPSNDVPSIVHSVIHSSPKRERQQRSSLPEIRACTPPTKRQATPSPLNTETATHMQSRTSSVPASIGGPVPVSQNPPPTTSSSISSGCGDSKLKISDDLRVATADSIACQWRHVAPGLPPCTHSCSPLDMWMHIRTAHVLGNTCKWGECDRTRGFSNLKRHAEGDHFGIKWRCSSTGCDLSFSRVDSLARHLKTKHYCVSGNAVEEDDEIESARSSSKGSQEAQRPQRASKASRKRPADENLDQSSRKKPYKHVRSQ